MAYECLAGEYDPLTRDVDYEGLADYLIGKFVRMGIRDGLILDLACGTGTLSCLLARRGYEVIGVDVSADMLTVAQSKMYAEDWTGLTAPVFIMQDMRELDLYGTVRAAVCTLDGFNHILGDKDLCEILRRLRLFIEPGGALIFDVNTPDKFRRMDGQAYLDETESVFCAWSVALTDEKDIYQYEINLFEKNGKLWRRSCEGFCERAWSPEQLAEMLERAGFGEIRFFGDRSDSAPAAGEQRIFVMAKRFL